MTNLRNYDIENDFCCIVKDLTSILKMIADDWLKDKTDRELCVMKNRARNARAITIFGYVFMTVGFSLLVFLPCFGMSLRYVTNITDPEKILPLQTYYFYDKDQSPYFELTYMAQGLLLVTAGASYTGVDNLLELLIFHLCGQMENLKERLLNMRQFKTFNNNLAFIVKDHIRLIKFRVSFSIALEFTNLEFILLKILYVSDMHMQELTDIAFSDTLISSRAHLHYYYSDYYFILVFCFAYMDF